MSHRQLRHDAESHHTAKMHRMLGGHVDKADERADKAMITKAIHEHEQHDHKGEKPTKMQFKRGGGVDENERAAPRLDRPGRARGGSSKHKGAHVNVIVAPQVPGMGQGPAGAPPAALMPPHPPMAPPPMMPPGGAPMGAPGGMAGGPPIGAMAPHVPMMPGGAPMMPPRKRGGSVDYPIDDGAAGGEGRLEKARAYGKNADEGEGRKRGGPAR